MALFPVPMMIYQVFTRVGPLIMMALSQAATFARMAVGFVVNAIVMRFNLLVARVRNIFTMVVNAIRSRLSNARTVASNLAQMIRQQIVNKFNQIIARVRSIFQNIVSTIRSRLANGVSTARQKAQEILQGIKDKISSIPGIVADEFGKIPGKIQSALASAASAALSGAANIVSSFLSGLQRHSPGKIQRETVAEFNSLPGIIAGSGVRAIGETTSMARGIVSAWNGNMTGLGFGVEGSLDSSIPQFNAFSPMNMNPVRRGTTGMVYNNTNTNDNHATHIHVENISLDCNNLTKQESRQILYDALDGLYTGGV
jgi:phage-related protein